MRKNNEFYGGYGKSLHDHYLVTAEVIYVIHLSAQNSKHLIWKCTAKFINLKQSVKLDESQDGKD